MTAAKRCTRCFELSDPRSRACWVCGGALVDAPPAPAEAPAGDDRSLRVLGWVLLIGGIGFVSLLVGVELALEWPGLLIPFALVMLVVFGGLGRTAWVHVRGARARAEEGTSGEEILRGVALALAITLAILALLFLLALAAVILFMMVCFAVIATMN